MIQKNASLFFSNLLLFLRVSRLLCHPQNPLETPQPAEDSFTNVSPSSLCRGCRKLFNFDPPTAGLSDEEFISPEATTLLGDMVNAVVDTTDGNQDSNMISNSTSVEALASIQSSNFNTNSHKERSEKDLEESRTTQSEKFLDSGVSNSMAEPFTVLLEYSSRMVPTSRSPPDVLEQEDSTNEKIKEDLDKTSASNSEKFWNSGDTNSIVWLSPQKGKTEGESHLSKQDSFSTSNPEESAMFVDSKQTNAEIKERNSNTREMNHEPLRNVFEDKSHQGSTSSLHPNEANADKEVNNLKSYPFVERYKADHKPLKNILANDKHHTEVTNTEQPANLLLNIEKVGGNGVQSPHYSQPLHIRAETSEVINEATKITSLNRDNYATFEVSSMPIPLRNNDEPQEKEETKDSTWDRRHLIFPEKIPPKGEEPKVLRLVSDEWDVEEEKSDFSAINRDVRPIRQENLGFSNVSTDSSTSESPAALTKVNGVVIKDSTERPKSNRKQNILQSKRADCEKGSGACLECKGISPYCHYNYRGKMCFYADNVHGNVLYECGVRFFPVDHYNTFFTALGVLIAVSLVVFFFLGRSFYRHILKKDPITDMEASDMRNVVHLIRDKRGL